MAECLLCKKDVTAGYVVCGDCAGKLGAGELPPVLLRYIWDLAEEIVNNDNICRCGMCVRGACDSQVSGLTCLNGVMAWLRAKAEKLMKTAPSSGTTPWPGAGQIRKGQKNEEIF